MSSVTIRQLRNQGKAVMDRVEAGETLTVTRNGEPVAELRPLPRRSVPTEVVLERFKNLPPVNYAQLRADIDAVIDPSPWNVHAAGGTEEAGD